MKKIEISTDKNRLDVEAILAFLQTSYWAKSRTKAQVQKSLDNSLCYGVYMDGQQIGLARIATDKMIFAYLMDVFIIEQHQGKGYAQELLKHIFADPELEDVQQWYLQTQDAHTLYEKYGFQSLHDPSRFMEKGNIQRTVEAR